MKWWLTCKQITYHHTSHMCASVMTQTDRFCGKNKYLNCLQESLVFTSSSCIRLWGGVNCWECCTSPPVVQLLCSENVSDSQPGWTGSSEGLEWLTSGLSLCTDVHKLMHSLWLTIVHGPHNAKSWSSNFIKGFSARDHFPENDAPAKHIALLTVIATWK